MHRALAVLDVILEIFAHLDPPPWSDDHSDIHENDEIRMLFLKSLAALARTCKTFHEPAMNLLWACIYGLSPLFGCVRRLHSLIYDRDMQCHGTVSAASYACKPPLAHLFFNIEWCQACMDAREPSLLA